MKTVTAIVLGLSVIVAAATTAECPDEPPQAAHSSQSRTGLVPTAGVILPPQQSKNLEASGRVRRISYAAGETHVLDLRITNLNSTMTRVSVVAVRLGRHPSRFRATPPTTLWSHGSRADFDAVAGWVIGPVPASAQPLDVWVRSDRGRRGGASVVSYHWDLLLTPP